jgi:Uma2 family endonuclease
MTTAIASYAEMIKQSIAHLPTGGSLVLPDVSWEDYQKVTTEMDAWPGIRLTYDRGRLEIMSTLAKHEKYKELLSDIARLISYETEIDLETLGSTTFSEDWLQRGAEPDTCFYVAHAAAIIGKDRIDLNLDPPPDIAVEVDVSSPSISKLSIYEEMRVPEVWLYDETRLQILRLEESGYAEISHSLSFPLVTSEALTQALEQSKTKGQSQVLHAFRKWLKTQLATEE